MPYALPEVAEALEIMPKMKAKEPFRAIDLISLLKRKAKKNPATTTTKRKRLKRLKRPKMLKRE